MFNFAKVFINREKKYIMGKINIGLETKGSKELSLELNKLLSNYQILYQNLRGFHWNVKGEFFFQLHEKFEELYQEIQERIDEVAERILTLENVPYHSFDEYIKSSSIKSAINTFDGKEASRNLVQSLKVIIDIERNILKVSEKINDEGTMSIISDYIKDNEKTIWLFRAYLS